MRDSILDGDQDDRCNWCGKRRLEVRFLLRAGDQVRSHLPHVEYVAICDECLELGAELVAGQAAG